MREDPQDGLLVVVSVLVYFELITIIKFNSVLFHLKDMLLDMRFIIEGNIREVLLKILERTCFSPIRRLVFDIESNTIDQPQESIYP